jgi:hypothetical protein
VSESPAVEVTGSGARWSRRRITVIALVVALVAAGGSYLGVSLTAGSGIPTSGLTTLWSGKHLASGCVSTSDNVPWTTGDLAVTCSGKGIAAYRLGTGQAAWTWQPPASPGAAALRAPGPVKYSGKPLLSILALSAGTTDGVGVVEYTYGYGAIYLAGVQVATGHELWRLADVKVTDGSVIWAGDGRFALVGDTSVTAKATTVRVYDAASGTLDWSSTSGPSSTLGTPGTPGSALPRACDPESVAIAGTSLYALANCPVGGDTGSTDQLYQLDLATGDARGHAALQDGNCAASGDDSPTLWAVPGYVLSGCGGAPVGGPDVLVIPAGGTRQLQLSYSGSPKYVNWLSADLTPPDLAVYGTTMYLGTSLSVGDSSVYLASAVDLRTDRLQWSRIVSVPGEPGNSVTYPVNLVGASERGALDVIENVSSDAEDLTGTTGMTLAVLSASDGTVTYGPGTTYPAGLDNQPRFTLIGHTLLAVPPCATVACGEDGVESATVAGYGTGSWPS